MENKEVNYMRKYSWVEFIRVFTIVLFGGLGLIIIMTSESRIWQIILGLVLIAVSIGLLMLEKNE